jgi:hypothetical protein
MCAKPIGTSLKMADPRYSPTKTSQPEPVGPQFRAPPFAATKLAKTVSGTRRLIPSFVKFPLLSVLNDTINPHCIETTLTATLTEEPARDPVPRRHSATKTVNVALGGKPVPVTITV